MIRRVGGVSCAFAVGRETCRPGRWKSVLQSTLQSSQRFGSCCPTFFLIAPGGDHAGAVAQCRGQSGVLLVAHVCSLVQVLTRELHIDKEFRQSKYFDAGMALHAILFHFLADERVPLSPLVYSAAEQKLCKAGWTVAKRAADKFYPQMRKAREKERLGDNTLLDELRSKVFEPESHTNLRSGYVAKKAGGGGGSEPPSVSEAVWRQTTDALVAFAMGTHTRVGESYASRDAWPVCCAAGGRQLGHAQAD